MASERLDQILVSGDVPRHVAVIMDGNGRWAQQRGLPRHLGHREGMKSVREAIEGAVEAGVEILTLFAFSTENWRRPADEVQFLLRFNEQILINRRDEMHERNMRIRFIGRRDRRVPRRLVRLIDDAEEMTRGNSGLTFTVAFNYGGRAGHQM